MTMHSHDLDLREARRLEEEMMLERERLSAALSALQDKVSPLTLVQDNLDLPLGLLQRAFQRNPLAVTLAGAGIAWLMLGKSGQTKAAESEAARLMRRHEDLSRWEDEGGPPPPEPEMASVAGEWLADAEKLRVQALARLGRLEDEVKSKRKSLEEAAKAKAQMLSDLAVRMRETMSKGLDDMTQAAQQKAIEAREALWAARMQASEKVEQNPLTSVGCAAAAGFLAGALLMPRRGRH